jgi:hypothetical protein
MTRGPALVTLVEDLVHGSGAESLGVTLSPVTAWDLTPMSRCAFRPTGGGSRRPADAEHGTGQSRLQDRIGSGGAAAQPGIGHGGQLEAQAR